jgi:hypothetical protein
VAGRKDPISRSLCVTATATTTRSQIISTCPKQIDARYDQERTTQAGSYYIEPKPNGMAAPLVSGKAIPDRTSLHTAERQVQQPCTGQTISKKSGVLN